MRRTSIDADASVTAPAGPGVPDDGALVARAIGGDQASFAVLFRRHAGDVHRFAQRRTGSVDLADDVTALAFEKAWRSLDRLGRRHGDRFRPWVFRIAANEMASLMRSQARRRRREHLAAATGRVPTGGRAGGSDDAAILAVETALDGDTVLRALGTLPDRYQDVISLRYLADLGAAETAVAMGVSRGNVAVLLHRAIAALRTAIEEDTP